VRAQARALLAEMKVAAVKLGVLGSMENAQAISSILPEVPVVLDPVLASGRGDPLASRETISVLLSRTTIATPRRSSSSSSIRRSWSAISRT
jgi:hydroxymethylpyrimidine/phosphomethylpyrimidine kinase